jgi:hypothetical protein
MEGRGEREEMMERGEGRSERGGGAHAMPPHLSLRYLCLLIDTFVY